MSAEVAKPIAEAIKEVKAGSKAKFDETVELHFKLGLDVAQADQQLRTTTVLPHGTGKNVKVAVLAAKKVDVADLNLSDSDIVKLEKGTIAAGRDFDILITEPSFMPKLAKLGPVLGPAGVMPNPKTGTVTNDVETAVGLFKKGKVEIRTEPNFPLLHIAIGKVSFDDKNLIENFEEVLSTLKSAKPAKAKMDWLQNCFVTSTMGKSIRISLE